LFRADDNLESVYGRAALRQLYLLLYGGKIEDCSLAAFEDATGLALTDRDGSLLDAPTLSPADAFNHLAALLLSPACAVGFVRFTFDRVFVPERSFALV
jgi:hypothetical protein